jgi:hypothetical protein
MSRSWLPFGPCEANVCLTFGEQTPDTGLTATARKAEHSPNAQALFTAVLHCAGTQDGSLTWPDHSTENRCKNRCSPDAKRAARWRAARKTWCGEGDLNPHELSPASTSKHLTGFCGGSESRKSLKILEGGFTALPRISGGPLQNRCSRERPYFGHRADSSRCTHRPPETAGGVRGGLAIRQEPPISTELAVGSSRSIDT